MRSTIVPCIAIAGAVLVLAADPAWPANPLFHDQPASPQSLPADNLPPFNMVDAQGRLKPMPPIPPGALHRGKDAPPESTAAGPGLELAELAARAAVRACEAQGYRIGVAVVDSVGEARALLTADGSDGSHVFVAMRKAIVSVAFADTSAHALERVQADPAELRRVTPAMFVEGGAVPIIVDGKLLGAIGGSGAAGEPIGHADELCAQAGLDAIRPRLLQRAR